jgi:hypothetical protein
MMSSVARSTIVAVPLITISHPSFVPIGKALAGGAHASMEALSTFRAKALSRFHGTPPIAVLVLFATPTVGVAVVPGTSKAIGGAILRVIRPSAEAEAIGPILTFQLLQSFIGVARPKSAC